MTMFKRLGFALLAATVSLICLALSESLLVPGVGIVSPAQAVVGRPLTPLSYAGVARRTARRCRAGVYYC